MDVKKNILLTGAAGFIGSSLAHALVNLGHKITTIDNLSTGYESNIPMKAEFIKGDCQDPAIIQRLKEYKFDVIYHIAGQSSGEVSFESPVYDLQTNAQSTLQLLQLALEVGCSKFIYASTMSVYGDSTELPIKEPSRLQPKSFYGVGKVASEHYMRIFSAQYGISTAALRLFNVYGPGQNLENLKQGMVSIFVAQAFKNKKIHVKGSPSRFRDFIYIDDVVNAFIKTESVMQMRNHIVFNVCTGKKTTVRELIDSITTRFVDDIPVTYEGSTPGDQFGIYGDPTLMRDYLGHWEMTIFDIGMKKFIQSVKESL